jgi:hypothetical protein
VNDASDQMTSVVLNRVQVRNPDKVLVLTLSHQWGCIGGLKNLGVCASQARFGRGDYLYVMDNDGYYLPEWDDKMVRALECGKVELVGPYRHPYHQPNGFEYTLGVPGHTFKTTDAVQGLGHMMTWETWDYAGPYAANAKGTNQSEDFALCRKIVDQGYMIGSVQPNVALNCGITDSFGRPCIGAEVMTERVEGVIYE